jgi:predicted ribosomally synthesized peptide with nif11-like leader
MDKMRELYEKVAKDSALQEKFSGIMKAAEKAGKDETEKKLVAFAKETGYEVTVEEMVGFFKNLEAKEGTLSEEELDAVAGGKAYPGAASVTMGMPGCQPVLVSIPSNTCLKFYW